MSSRIRRALSRAKYAAILAALGAGLGGLISRNTASTGAAAGALFADRGAQERAEARNLPEAIRKRAGTVGPDEE